MIMRVWVTGYPDPYYERTFSPEAVPMPVPRVGDEVAYAGGTPAKVERVLWSLPPPGQHLMVDIYAD